MTGLGGNGVKPKRARLRGAAANNGNGRMAGIEAHKHQTARGGRQAPAARLARTPSPTDGGGSRFNHSDWEAAQELDVLQGFLIGSVNSLESYQVSHRVVPLLTTPAILLCSHRQSASRLKKVFSGHRIRMLTFSDHGSRARAARCNHRRRSPGFAIERARAGASPRRHGNGLAAANAATAPSSGC